LQNKKYFTILHTTAPPTLYLVKNKKRKQMKVISILAWSDNNEKLLCVVESTLIPRLVTQTHGSSTEGCAWCVSMGARQVHIFSFRPGVMIVIGQLDDKINHAHVPLCSPKDALVAKDDDLECYLWFLVFESWASDTAVLVTSGIWYPAISALRQTLPFKRNHILFNGSGRLILRTKNVAWKVRLIANAYEAKVWEDEQKVAREASRCGVGPRVCFTQTLNGCLGVLGMDWLPKTVKSVLFSSPPLETLQRLRDACLGLAERLASIKILHLDFKPDNLAFNEEGKLFALDFGEGWASIQPSMPRQDMVNTMLFILSVHTLTYGKTRLPFQSVLHLDCNHGISRVLEQTDSWDLLLAYKPKEVSSEIKDIVRVLSELLSVENNERND
jgi:hypothetical protein